MPSLIARCQAAWAAFRAADPAVQIAPGATGAPPDPHPEIPRYPPFLNGLPRADTARILETQRELIASLQDALALTDADYQSLVLPLVERYAAFVHLLPASETHHHRGAGGLFRHGLEVAFQAARASRGRLFALDRLAQERRLLEPRWHLAAGIAGLLHDVGKPVADVTVFDRTGTHRWQPLDETLFDWAQAHGIDRYFLRWNSQRVHHGHELFTTPVLHQLLTRAVRTWLMDPDPLVWHTLSRVLAGSDTQALLYQLLRAADQASVAQDLRENRLDPEAFSLGVPIERYLVDTMRSLLRDGTWAVNVPGARVWVFPPNRVHLVWPACAEAIVQRLTDARIPGIPQDPDTLADILIERHLVHPPPQDAGTAGLRYWRLAPAILAREQPVELSFLRLASPGLLFSGVVPVATALLPLPSSTPAPASETGPPASIASPVAQDAHPDEPACPVAVEPTATPRAPGPMPVSSPPADAARARAWLEQQGPVGRTLLALVEAQRQERLTATAQPSQVDGKLFLPYPQALSGFDTTAAEIREHLAARNWIERDPLRPLLELRDQAGVSGLWLTREVSRPLIVLGLGAPTAPASVPPVPLVAPVLLTPPDRPAVRASTAADYALGIRQRLLARDPTLGPISERPGAQPIVKGILTLGL